MQNFSNIHIIGVLAIFLAGAYPISPILFSVLSISVMVYYINSFYKNVFQDDLSPIHNISSNIIIKSNIPIGFLFFLFRILFAFLVAFLILLFQKYDSDNLLFLIQLLIFSIIQFYVLILIKVRTPFYYQLSNDSIESHFEYTNRIYYRDLKTIKVIKDDYKYRLIAKNGNVIKLNLNSNSETIRREVFHRLKEIAKQFNVVLI